MEGPPPSIAIMRPCLRTIAAALLSLGSAPRHLPAQPSTAAEVPSVRVIDAAPFPSALVTSPKRDVIAWVQNAAGARSLWVAQAPKYEARQIVQFPGDDGQELAELAFSSDSKTLWFVRGSAPNRNGENPNPSSDPGGAEQALWRVRVDIMGATASRIIDGSRPTPAPIGDSFVFIRRGQATKLVEVNGRTEGAPLFRMRGSASELRWSPDGSRLAVVSNRGTHSFVGVFEPAANALRWISPSTDGDQSPIWSPDGTRLAFLRVPYEKRRMIFLPIRESQPWSIRVADAKTGNSTEVFRAAPGRGSAFWAMQAESQILWTSDDRLVFPWERDGFLHLYSVPSIGGAWTQLDRGSHEVEYVTLDATRRQVVFNSNQDDQDRRHVWRVAANGENTPTAVTTGRGIEWMPAPLADGAVAYLASDARQPAHAAIQEKGTGSPRALAPTSMPAAFPKAALVEPSPVTFKAADGITSYGQLFLPPVNKFPGKRPAIIFIHGGSRRQMLLGWNYGSYYHHAYALNQALALRGWIVVQLNFRSGIGYGRDFREALNYGAAGASEYQDLLAAARWLHARADVDPTKVALWGGSYGGYMTAHGLTRNPELFAAGVDIHGVHDWNVGIQTFLPEYNRLEDPAATERAFLSSPLAQVSRWRDPVLLVHGDDDRNVRFIETLTLIEQLRKQQVPVEQLVFPDEVHSFLRHDSWMRAFEGAIDFLERRVLGRR
ncbi:MAG: hypothetical protein RLZZ621_911 [Gemmatimonadota bacterium]